MSKKKQPQRVWVTIYHYKDGVTVDVFKTEEAAEKHRDNTAIEYWDVHFSGLPMPENDVGDVYFDFIEQFGQEWFEIEEQEITE